LRTRPRAGIALKMPLRIYTLSNCDTCRRATKWLRGRGLQFAEVPIRETPPTAAELKRVLAAQRGELRRLFNTSGRDYRELKIGDRLATLTVAEALELLASNGNLVKRPILISENVELVGFDEQTWAAALE
jgi:arsenate reductase